MQLSIFWIVRIFKVAIDDKECSCAEDFHDSEELLTNIWCLKGNLGEVDAQGRFYLFCGYFLSKLGYLS